MIRFHLKWWLDANRFVQGTFIHPPDPNAFLFTDASHYGWGGHLEPMRLSFHGRWSEDQSQLHISILEMMAICLALKKAIKYIHHSCVMISTDNTTVVSYINKQEGTKLLTQNKKKFQHPNLPLLALHAWELSSNQLEIKSFHKMLQTWLIIKTNIYSESLWSKLGCILIEGRLIGPSFSL